uniref:Uncharacterized protein n=1 Tax=Siphoviridae sp. ct16C7 TaxID=2825304 RepID=A0A8S5NZG3_9CAUD|nr:MAG TPA: hypothetical protein [Siphoviridae sp. ct16C7]
MKNGGSGRSIACECEAPSSECECPLPPPVLFSDIVCECDPAALVEPFQFRAALKEHLNEAFSESRLSLFGHVPFE